AEPPAESPSTMYNSLISASREEQSDNFPGKLETSKALFLRVKSRAFLAAIRAWEAINPFSIIVLAIVGFSNKYFENTVLRSVSVTVRTLLLPSFVLV